MANYPIAPWLHPQDTVGPYVQGLHLGAQIQQEREKLSQQANEAAVRASLQQQQIEQESMQAQQRLEVTRAQQQQENALKQQELAQHQQTIQMATEQAARKYQAMQSYQEEVSSGGDPLKAILKYGPAMGQQGSPEAAAIRASQMQPQADLPTEVRGRRVLTAEGVPVPGMIAVPSSTGKGLTVRDIPKQGDELSVSSAAMLLRELPRIDGMAGTDPTDANSLSATLGPELRKKVLGAVKRTPAATSGPPATAAVAATGEPQKVTSKAEFDALPSGTVYIGRDGKKYKKS